MAGQGHAAGVLAEAVEFGLAARFPGGVVAVGVETGKDVEVHFPEQIIDPGVSLQAGSNASGHGHGGPFPDPLLAVDVACHHSARPGLAVTGMEAEREQRPSLHAATILDHLRPARMSRGQLPNLRDHPFRRRVLVNQLGSDIGPRQSRH
jgi:hypothetical protein